MKNKKKQCLFISAACILLIMVCIGAEIFSKSNQEAEEAPPVVMLKDQYNGYGLPVGTELSAKILLENQELVCYTDRIFVHFQPKEDSVQRIKAIVDGMNHKCPELENIYILPIPHRILAETGYEEEAVFYQTHLDAIASEMPENAVVVNALDELSEHTQEYVFFRTQDAWTARGAYYGTTELCEELGLDVIPLESYYEYTYNTFTGDLPAREDMKMWMWILSLRIICIFIFCRRV